MEALMREVGRLAGGLDVIGGPDAEHYRRDASHATSEMPRCVVRARSREEVQAVLAWADAHRVPVVPRGAGTGVSGGAVPLAGSIVLSTERMDRILEVRPGDRLAVVEPGATVREVDEAARRHGLMYAPDPASLADATVGGTVATNAGGFRCLKYGVTSDAVAALEVVLAGGEVLRTGARSRKNAVGYDLTRLIVGSEGTLGVVTEATLRLVPRPVGEPHTFRVSFPSLGEAGRAVAGLMAGTVTPELLELLDRPTVRMVEAHSPSGLDPDAEATLIGQVAGPNAAGDLGEIERALVDAGGTGFAVSEGDSLLEARRRVRPALSALEGVTTAGSDAAVPPTRLPDLLAAIREQGRSEGLPVSVAAHAGDGNIHAAVLVRDGDERQAAAAERILRAIAAEAVRLGGTISGEHGIGSLKEGLLELQLDAVSRDLHRRIKAAFDPHGILNPGRAV